MISTTPLPTSPNAAAQPACAAGGYVLLPRILDKGRASLVGKLGEYHYAGKGMDRISSTSSASTMKL